MFAFVLFGSSITWLYKFSNWPNVGQNQNWEHHVDLVSDGQIYSVCEISFGEVLEKHEHRWGRPQHAVSLKLPLIVNNSNACNHTICRPERGPGKWPCGPWHVHAASVASCTDLHAGRAISSFKYSKAVYFQCSASCHGKKCNLCLWNCWCWEQAVPASSVESCRQSAKGLRKKSLKCSVFTTSTDTTEASGTSWVHPERQWWLICWRLDSQ